MDFWMFYIDRFSFVERFDCKLIVEVFEFYIPLV